ncbi:unnamed protein product (macronuclear) [Paramecium tetraurelia]|uniref:Uncharacterized protein n=1 Tax=Paramecium tetraurelia TaxID=5888 RepID=A0CM11_PARTE|nr:uncharacterized protein GSPATT00008307001 [Paramecium tetraurelia]CAK71828.1 unnamed protein product [Paramecium tetraurelia]|eukprot:XP_001439225.1 hypothetical protein (macronuclear) [Paramecium tetraurelia strain d4-2]
MTILLSLFIIIANKPNQNQYIVLIDTDSETASKKINCTYQQLNGHYNHADSSLALFHNPQNVVHIVVQDQTLQIKEEYLECALFQLHENHLGSVIVIPINSVQGFSQKITGMLQVISEKYEILIYIAQHPMNYSSNQINEKITSVRREELVSSSELSVRLGIRTIL